MERKVIATLSIGEQAQQWADISYPFTRRYAERIGADFFCLSTGIDGLSPSFAKLKLGELLDLYDRMAYIDGDILVAPNAPDLFAEVAPARIGATCVHTVQEFTKREVAQLQQVFGALPSWDGSYFNAGLMVLSREHKPVMDEALAAAPAWNEFSNAQSEKCFEDQSLMNYFVQKHGVGIQDLGYKYNHTRAFTNLGVARQHRFHSHFIHYAGHRGHRRGNRIKQMRTDAAIMESRWLYSLLRGSSGLARVSDWL